MAQTTKPTPQSSDPADREALEILNMVDAIRRMMTDMPVERKRLLVEQIDKWVALEEAGGATRQ
jgi:hypothetical protein